MNRFIKPTSVGVIKGPMGYTVLIERKGQSGLVEQKLSLGSVIDVGWSKAKELEKLLETFLEDEPDIILDDMRILEYKIGSAQKQKESLIRGLTKLDDELVKLAKASRRIAEER